MVNSPSDITRIQNIIYFLSSVDLTTLDLWDDLDVLSTNTQVEAIDIPPEGVLLNNNGRFTAVLNIYLILQYGRNNDEGFATADSFVAKVSGHIEDGTPAIDSSNVDTSSFYE